MKRFINIITEGQYGDHTPAEFERDDDEFYDARDKTGFFGNQGAGCIILAAKTGRIMVVERSASVEEPHTWGNCGGAHKSEEMPRDAALRELHEETGYKGEAKMIPLMVFQKGTFRYSNFLAIIEDEFVPQLGWEADDYRWCEFGDWPTPLHFGLQGLFSDPASVKTIQHYISIFTGNQTT